jgi:hypothetical protein
MECSYHLFLKLFVHVFLGPLFSAHVLNPFKIADSNSTSIGEYIGYNEYLSVVEYLVSLRSRRTVCPLGNYLGLDSGGVTLRYTVLQDFWN